MKIVKIVLFSLGMVVTSLVALAFAFVEIRSLFAGDFTLMASAFIGFFASFSRITYYLFILALAITLTVFKIRKQRACFILFVVSIVLLICSFITFAFYDYFVTLVIIFANVILVVITSLDFFKKETQKSEEL